MKKAIETAPVIEAFAAGDECPFCYLQRLSEQRAIRYILGPSASYMEPDVRAITDSQGFCGIHLKKLYDYGNALGNALILQTHFIDLNRELEQELDRFKAPEKRRPFSKPEQPALLSLLQRRNQSCYLCSRLEDAMGRYIETFYALIKDPEFRQQVESCKGFCLHHLQQLLKQVDSHLPRKQYDWFYPTVARLTRENLSRVQGDLDWFIAKFDYRNASADWKNSRDAVSRSMQKLQGIYPADPPYKKDG